MKRLLSLVFAFLFVLVGIHMVSAQIQGQWVVTGTMQTGREFNAQVKLGSGKVLSIGGVDNNNNVLASAEIYNASSGTWTLTGSMALQRETFPAVLTTGKVLAAGGAGAGGTVLASAELYNPMTGVWSAAGPLSLWRGMGIRLRCSPTERY